MKLGWNVCHHQKEAKSLLTKIGTQLQTEQDKNWISTIVMPLIAYLKTSK